MAKKITPTPPNIFDLEQEVFDKNDLFGLFTRFNVGYLKTDWYHDIDYPYGIENGSTLMLQEKRNWDGSRSVKMPVVYFDANGTAWTTEISYNNTVDIYDHSKSHSINPFFISDSYLKSITNLKYTPWQLQTKLANFATLQSPDELWQLLKAVNPYGEKHARDKGYRPEVLLWCPFIEILDKAGYESVHRLIYFHNLGGNSGSAGLAEFNRLCKRGNSPKEIFQTSKATYTILKDEKSLVVWDIFRKLDKFAKIPKEDYERFYNMNLYRWDIKKIYGLLSLTDAQGKRIFPTLDSFMLYFDKINMYEAIRFDEGLVLVSDYVNMCKQLNIQPNLDSDSLKREHDVVARLSREKKDVRVEKRLNEACAKLAKFDYEEETFIIRGIRNYDDLINEARQQRSCLASYANYIAEQKSMIYVMREKKNPDKSLVTIEVTPDLKIRQKKLACNRPIRSKAQSDFIDRWAKHIKTV